LWPILKWSPVNLRQKDGVMVRNSNIGGGRSEAKGRLFSIVWLWEFELGIDYSNCRRGIS